MSIPELSRFELTCLRHLWRYGEASIREIHGSLPLAPSYSTVRKIFERLEQKGAIARVRRAGRAWTYRSTVTPSAIIRKEVRRLVDGLFDGHGASLVAHLADLEAITLEDLRDIEDRLRDRAPRNEDGQESPERRAAPRRRRK